MIKGERVEGDAIRLWVEDMQADMSSTASGSCGTLCYSFPASGHPGLAVTCWEPEAVRSVLEAAQGWGRLCVPTAMGNHHFKAFT